MLSKLVARCGAATSLASNASRRRCYSTAKNTFFRSQAYINGRWLDSDSHQEFPVLNPTTNEIIGGVADCDEQDFELASQAAHQAFAEWSRTTAKHRSRLLRQLAEAQMANQRELAELITLETGKPIKEAMNEIAYGASFCDWFADQVTTGHGKVLSSSNPSKTLLSIKQPAGPVGIITSWNFPNAMITRKLSAILAAGCTAVVKPPPESPYSALAVAKIIDELDIQPGVVNILPSSADNAAKIGSHMCKSKLLRVLSFTGSSQVGKLLLQQSASTVKRVWLELGGNAPFLVFNSADLEKAASGYVAIKFKNAGQTCISPNRCLVQEEVYDKFLELVKAKVASLKMGDPMDEATTFGCLINKEALKKVDSHVQDALGKGAQLVLGGKALTENQYEPTLLRGANHEMLCYQEETFGPLAAVGKFKTEAEALEMANSVKHGLAAYFYSEDINQVRRVSQDLETGMVGVNEGLISACEAPFGGVKESGLGREGGHTGIEEYQETKYICMGS